MSDCRLPLPTLLTLALCGALVPGASHAEWGQPLGANSTNRADGPALITADGTTSAGIAWSLALAPEPLADASLMDMDGSGTPEVVFVASGRVFALDPYLSGPAWASPAQGIDGILGLGEIDGDPTTTELVASSRPTGGGFLFLDAALGGLLGGLGPFDDLSGAEFGESVLYDLDGDGIDEIIHPPGRYGIQELWVSTLGAGIASPGLLEVDVPGYANLTPAFVGDFLGTGAPVIVVDQGSRHTWYPTCPPTHPDATCDDGPGTVCVCSPQIFQPIHSTYMFGERWVLNVDDDPQEELVEVGLWPTFIKGIAVLDFADGLAGGSPDADATRQWYRKYNATSPNTQMAVTSDGPIDINGDGDLEIIVSFFNNDGSDSDATGTIANDDGIDNGDGVSVGIFDLATGALLASVDDAFGWGVADLDADGSFELVTSPTNDFSFEAGLTGQELNCTNGTNCSLDQVWTDSSLTLHPLLASFENNVLPPAKLYTVDNDGDGVGELLAYDGTTLVAVSESSGGVSVEASRQLQPDEILLAFDPDTNTAATTTATNVTVFDGSLSTIGSPIRIPSRGWKRFAAASLDGGTREAPIFDGQVFQTAFAPTSTNQGDHALYPGLGLVRDLDGDGQAEILSYANAGSLDNDDSTFEIRLDEWDAGSSSFATLWEFDSENHPEFTGFGVGSNLHISYGDFDGTGADDVVVELVGSGVYHYVVLDGDTGALDATFTPTERAATNTPLYVADMVDADGDPNPDGIADLLIDGPNFLSVHTVANGEVWSVDVGGFIHGVGAFADVDDDGDRELVSTFSVTTSNVAEVLDDLDTASPSTTWGPSSLPLPTDQVQVLAIAELDGVAGDDFLYISGDGGVHGYSGSTGAPIAGLPVYLAAGMSSTTPIPSASNPLSLLAIDVDDDGHEEAVVGTTDGFVYAVDVALDDPDAPGLLWSFVAGAAVRALSAADTDGDGYDEILLSTDDGSGSVLDGLGVSLNITFPLAGDCVPSSTFQVSGTAAGLATVEVLVAGASISGDVDATSGVWVADAEARGTGAFTLVARGKDANGVITAFDTELIEVGIDEDSDGWFACADCNEDDADINPGAEDVCEDGIDQDCDGADAECGDDDDATSDDDDTTTDDDDTADDDDDDDSGDDGGGCGGACDGCSSNPDPSGAVALSLFALGLAVRRRRV